MKSASQEVPPSGAHERLEQFAWPVSGLNLPNAGGVALPFPLLLEASQYLGHVTLAVDRDGVVRRVPLLVEYLGKTYPSMALQLAALHLQKNGEHPTLLPHRRGAVLEWNGDRILVPLDKEGSASILFPGGPGVFPHRYGMLEVVQAYRDRRTDWLQEAFGGKVVLVGSSAVGQAATDLGATPFDPVSPLMYVHAAAVNSILSGRFIQRPTMTQLLIGLAVLGLLLGWLVLTLSLPMAAVAAVLTAAFSAAVSQGMFAFLDWDIPTTAPVILCVVSYATIASYRFVALEKWERWRNKELQLAHSIQTRLLPREAPVLDHLDVYGANIPAQEVGGDYYDWVVDRAGGLTAVLGDVTGKGVGAALLVSHLRASFHAEAGRGTADQVITAMHNSLYRATEPTHFATFFLAVLPADREELTFCSAGHNPALLLRNGELQELTASGPPLAILDACVYTEQTVPFSKGDLLVIYSDGVTESPVSGGMYGEERLESLVRSMDPHASAKTVVERILQDLKSVSTDMGADDITLVAIRRTI